MGAACCTARSAAAAPGELGKGWVAYTCDDPDGIEQPDIVVYCPPCAAPEFGYRPDFAEKYVCAWEPLPSEPTEAAEAS